MTQRYSPRVRRGQGLRATEGASWIQRISRPRVECGRRCRTVSFPYLCQPNADHRTKDRHARKDGGEWLQRIQIVGRRNEIQLVCGIGSEIAFGVRELRVVADIQEIPQ